LKEAQGSDSMNNGAVIGDAPRRRDGTVSLLTGTQTIGQGYEAGAIALFREAMRTG
jgi:hypothetical protein